MNKEVARKINGLRMVQNELTAYAEAREAQLQKSLTTASLDQVQSLQGAFFEVQRLRRLNEEIEQYLKEA